MFKFNVFIELDITDCEKDSKRGGGQNYKEHKNFMMNRLFKTLQEDEQVRGTKRACNYNKII